MARACLSGLLGRVRCTLAGRLGLWVLGRETWVVGPSSVVVTPAPGLVSAGAYPPQAGPRPRCEDSGSSRDLYLSQETTVSESTHT